MVGRCFDAIRVKRNDNRCYNNSATGTVSGSDGKGSKYMYSRLKKIAGYVFIELMLTAIFVGMVIAVAVIPY